MKLTKYIVSVFLCIFLLSGMLLFFVSDKKEFSENENRVLAKIPEFSFDSLESGKYLLKIEDYMKDHLPARDILMKIKTKAQIACGFKKINGVYISDGRLIQNITEPNGKIFIDSTNRLFENIGEEIKTAVVLVPTSAAIYPEALPSYAETVDESVIIGDILSSINCDIKPDLISVFNNAKTEGDLFYKTDHHWTSRGGFIAYKSIMDELGRDLSDLKFDITPVSDDFRGTLYSKVLDDSLFDTIEQYNAADVVFTCKSGNSPDELSDSEYYAKDYLSKKDKYAYFGNENQPLIVLENESCENDDELVLIKDSFANCIAPLFTANYKKVHIIDTRYMKKPKASEYINANENITDVIVLYGLDSLNNNTGISRIS